MQGRFTLRTGGVLDRRSNRQIHADECAYGLYKPDEGGVVVDGSEVQLARPIP